MLKSDTETTHAETAVTAYHNDLVMKVWLLRPGISIAENVCGGHQRSRQDARIPAQIYTIDVPIVLLFESGLNTEEKYTYDFGREVLRRSKSGRSGQIDRVSVPTIVGLKILKRIVWRKLWIFVRVQLDRIKANNDKLCAAFVTGDDRSLLRLGIDKDLFVTLWTNR